VSTTTFVTVICVILHRHLSAGGTQNSLKRKREKSENQLKYSLVH